MHTTIPGIILRHAIAVLVRVQQLQQRAPVCKLQHQIQMVSLHKHVVQLNDVVVAQNVVVQAPGNSTRRTQGFEAY